MNLSSLKKYFFDVATKQKPVPWLGIGVIVVIIIAIWLGIYIHGLHSEIDKLHNKIEEADSLHKVADGQYERKVQDYYSESELNAALRDSNSAMAKDLKKKNAKLLELTSFTIQVRPDSAVGKVTQSTVDTVHHRSRYEFTVLSENRFATFDGWLLTNPDTAGGVFSYALLDSCEIVLYEDTDGFINARVHLDDRIASLSSFSVQRLKPTTPGDGWRFRTGIGAVKGFGDSGYRFGLGALIGVSYGSWGISGIVVPNGFGSLLTKDF